MSSGKSSLTGSNINTSSSGFENIKRLITDFYNWVVSFFSSVDTCDDGEKTVFLKTTRRVKKFKLMNHYYSPQLKRRRVFMPDLDPREIYILE